MQATAFDANGRRKARERVSMRAECPGEAMRLYGLYERQRFHESVGGVRMMIEAMTADGRDAWEAHYG